MWLFIVANSYEPPLVLYYYIYKMEKVQLVYAELINGVSLTMREDPLVHIVSDTAVFMVTTLQNSVNYTENFYPVDAEAIEAYHLLYSEGRVSGKLH
jgi:hypothetical protein